MSNKIPDASEVIRGLLNQESYVKLQTLSGSFTGPLSSSIIQAHNLTASYCQFISGNVNKLTATYVSASQAIINTLTLNNDSVYIQLNGGIEGIYLTNSVGSTLAIDPSFIDLNGGATYIDPSNLSSFRSTLTEVTATYLNLNSVVGVSAIKTKILGTNFSCSASTIQYLPFSMSIGANERWLVQGIIDTVLTGTGGIYFSAFSPTGSLINGWVADTVALRTINAEGASVVSTITLTEAPVDIRFCIRNGANAGTIRIGVRRGTATDFCHIITGSFITFTKDDLVY